MNVSKAEYGVFTLHMLLWTPKTLKRFLIQIINFFFSAFRLLRCSIKLSHCLWYDSSPVATLNIVLWKTKPSHQVVHNDSHFNGAQARFRWSFWPPVTYQKNLKKKNVRNTARSSEETWQRWGNNFKHEIRFWIRSGQYRQYFVKLSNGARPAMKKQQR